MILGSSHSVSEQQTTALPHPALDRANSVKALAVWLKLILSATNNQFPEILSTLCPKLMFFPCFYLKSCVLRVAGQGLLMSRRVPKRVMSNFSEKFCCGRNPQLSFAVHRVGSSLGAFYGPKNQRDTSCMGTGRSTPASSL